MTTISFSIRQSNNLSTLLAYNKKIAARMTLSQVSILCVWLLAVSPSPALAFSGKLPAPPKSAAPSPWLQGIETAWKSLLETTTKATMASEAPSSSKKERLTFLKETLLNTCLQQQATPTTTRGSKSSATTSDLRPAVEALMAELTPLSPITETSTSPLLQRKWKMLWTTEKEINFFVNVGWSDDITQTISENGRLLENKIVFCNIPGGYLGVMGKLSVDDDDDDDAAPDSRRRRRTKFVFTSATLDLGRWGSFPIPPLGKGWFDTLYLDDDLRIDINSRNDILICIPADE